MGICCEGKLSIIILISIIIITSSNAAAAASYSISMRGEI